MGVGYCVSATRKVTKTRGNTTKIVKRIYRRKYCKPHLWKGFAISNTEKLLQLVTMHVYRPSTHESEARELGLQNSWGDFMRPDLTQYSKAWWHTPVMQGRRITVGGQPGQHRGRFPPQKGHRLCGNCMFHLLGNHCCFPQDALSFFAINSAKRFSLYQHYLVLLAVTLVLPPHSSADV